MSSTPQFYLLNCRMYAMLYIQNDYSRRLVCVFKYDLDDRN